MAIVIGGRGGRARRAVGRAGELVISIGPAADAEAEAEVAGVGVSIRDDGLARRLTLAMARALRAEVAAPPRPIAVVRVRSRRALDGLGARVAGAIAVVPVTARNARHAGELVDALRGLGVAGVQLAWMDEGPPRGAAEARLFAVLEQVRATPGRAPVVLARGEEPVEALRILVDRRR